MLFQGEEVMNFWYKLKRWEKNLEQGPRHGIWKMLALVFSVSLAVGVFFSVQLTSYQVRAVDKIAQEIKMTEIIRMDRRLEMLEKLKYDQRK